VGEPSTFTYPNHKNRKLRRKNFLKKEKKNLDVGSEFHVQYSGESPHVIKRSLAESL